MSGQRTKAAVAQMCSTPDIEKNLKTIDRLVAEAHDERAELLMLPECFALLAPGNAKSENAESLEQSGPILSHLQKLAREAQIELVLGGFWEKSPEAGKVFNSCIHLRNDGTVSAVYRKIHLYDVDLADGTSLRESDGVTAGSEIVAAQTVLGTMGLSVCYDVRFPELYRRLVDQGATSLAIPAAFTLTTGKDHWHILLRARAIESQSYVLAAAQTGLHFGQRRSYGHALICDPWGNVLVDHGEGEGIVCAYVDQEVVESVRTQLPSLKHRRL